MCVCGGVLITGVDGGDIPTDALMINNLEFKKHDFRNRYVDTNRYALAMSLECAEHIPEKSVDEFIDTLTELSDVIMFSADIPYQRGNGHVNEQYQTYWIKKFNERGYQELDVIRLQVWNNPNVRGFYAENIFLYVKKDTSDYEALKQYIEYNRPEMYNVIHPQVWDSVNHFRLVKMMDKLHHNKFVSWLYYKFIKR